MRKRKMATVRYWNTATRAAANLGSSRRPGFEDDRRVSDSSGKSFTGRPEITFSLQCIGKPEVRLVSLIIPLNSGTFLQFVQKVKQRNRHNGVQQAQDQGTLRLKVHLLAEQGARQNPKDELMENKEEEAQDQADHRMVDVQTQPHRGRDVADYGLGNTEHAERVLRKGILRQADDGAHQQSADGAAAHQGEIYGNDQRQLEIRQELKKQRNIDLEKDRRQWHHDQNPPFEARGP